MTRPLISRRAFLASTAAAGTFAAAAGWPAAGRAEMGKVLRLRLDGDNNVLDPGYMVGGTEIEAQKQCLPFLAEYVREGDTFTWRPTYYVTKLEQRDPTNIDFELADGLQWSNGYGKLKASDVKFSFERMKDSDWSGYFDAMDRVEVTGDLTGTIVLSKPFAPFLMVTLCHGPGAIVCEQAVKDAGGKFTTDFPAICGPYTYSATPGQRVVFELNPEWTGPQPGFERVEANVITEVKASELDVDSILQGAYSNTTTKSHGIICPGLLGQRKQSGYSYDPVKAKALLDEAGVSGLELTLRTLNNQERMLTAQIIQANLSAVGITVKVLPLDSGPFWEMGQESKGDTWKDLELWIMRFGTTPDPYEATQWFVSDQVGVWNWERWTDPEFDRLYEEGIAETDTAKREEIYHRMQEIMEDTGAYLWINHEPESYAHSAGMTINAAPSGELNYRRFALT